MTTSMRRAGIAEWKEIGKCYEEIGEVSERERGGSRVERRERERDRMKVKIRDRRREKHYR